MLNKISPVDYSVFALSLLVPALVALYYAFVQRQKTTDAYFLGNRKMGAVPLAFSLAVSYLSATTITGVPGEVAYHGILFPLTWMVSGTLAMVSVGSLFIPVFYKMRLTSVYEYLEIRYNSRLVRTLASLSYVVASVASTGIVLYAPCLSLRTVTGLPLVGLVLMGGLIGTFYTVLGGLRAVVWTDLFQGLVMIGGLVAIIVQGTLAVGGPAEVWRIGEASGRVRWLNLDPSPFARATTWSVFFGQFVQWGAAYGCHQVAVQRYCSARSVAHARWSLLLTALLFPIVLGSAIVAGLVVYANYWSCDPKAEGIIDKTDEIAPLFVMQHLVKFYGVPGVFVAGLLSGALSSISSTLNSAAAVVFEDFLRPLPYFDRMSDAGQVRVTRIVASLIGFASIGIAVAASEFDGILQLGVTAVGLVSGPLLALFVLGLFTTVANKVGVTLGWLLGTAAPVWIFVGSFLRSDELQQIRDSSWSYNELETFAEGCLTPGLNSSHAAQFSANRTSREEEFFFVPPGDWQAVLYSTSFHLYSIIGFIVTILVGIFGSLIARVCYTPRRVEQFVLHPIIRCKDVADEQRFTTGKSGRGIGVVGPTGYGGYEYDSNLSTMYRNYQPGGGHFAKSAGGLDNFMYVEDDGDIYRRRKGPDGYHVEEHPRNDTHYRWPSPSLPPTLTKKPMKRSAAAAKSKMAAAAASAANRKRPSPTSSEREMMFSTSTTSAGTESTSDGQRRERRGVSTPKAFSRQTVLNACEAASSSSHPEGEEEEQQTASSSTGSSSASSSSSSASSTSSTSRSESSSASGQSPVELDEFGDIVPSHLQKNTTGTKKRKTSASYSVTEATSDNSGSGKKRSSKSKNRKNYRSKEKGHAVNDEEEWGTDF